MSHSRAIPSLIDAPVIYNDYTAKQPHVSRKQTHLIKTCSCYLLKTKRKMPTIIAITRESARRTNRTRLADYPAGKNLIWHWNGEDKWEAVPQYNQDKKQEQVGSYIAVKQDEAEKEEYAQMET
ncbi:uncharacterized protein LY79DRAFT_674841 [Colletotrichum navitas]|uniref:Uncharacterized protein n=1 Tax=Colletotrichum navitas TaxID=681940 RepID=A0AAD8PK64_9PEZI|nr:uncharacterized protein LY79DRAFT_674841 [Colletotrichum navitas]KAK1566258.1 hypothetical protein LY79DRAFT_674841 [Colletotrichum navitas]